MSQDNDINSNNKHSNALELGHTKKKSEFKLWASLWPDGAQILQYLCADWQWNTEECGDGGGANSWGISSNVSTIQTYCYDNHCLITLAAKEKRKRFMKSWLELYLALKNVSWTHQKKKLCILQTRQVFLSFCLQNSHFYSALQGSVWFQGRQHTKS